jgi:K+/H+ antiporter YhaU regulatory subunit KhtT
MKITKRQLRRIIKEEKAKALAEQDHEMYASDDELRALGDVLAELLAVSTQAEALMNDMGYRYGELVALGTNARTIKKSIQELQTKYDSKLDDMIRFK